MNEVKKARQQLDARNGLQPSGRKKAPKKKRQPPKQNTSAKQPARQQAVKSRPARQPASPVREPQRRPQRPPARQQPHRSIDAEERVHAQKAVAAKRKRRRKKNYALYYIILFIFIVVAGIVLSLTVFFNIDAIQVEGNSRYSAEEVIEKSGLRTGDNLFRISTGQAAEQLVSSLVYVDQVEINRQFPSAIKITITEAQPVMSFSSDGKGYSIVSAAGRILDSNLSAPAENTFIVNGVDLEGYTTGDFIKSDTGQGMNLLTTINEVCAELELTGVTRVDINSVVDIRIYLGERLRIDVGSITELQYKLTFAKELVDTRLSETDIGVIDVKQVGKAYFRPSETLESSSEPQGDPSPSDPDTQPPSGDGTASESGSSSSDLSESAREPA